MDLIKEIIPQLVSVIVVLVLLIKELIGFINRKSRSDDEKLRIKNTQSRDNDRHALWAKSVFVLKEDYRNDIKDIKDNHDNSLDKIKDKIESTNHLIHSLSERISVMDERMSNKK